VIVSHKHRFIFVAVPKTATQSIRAALRPYLGSGDWEQADWGAGRRLPVPEIAAIDHGHVAVTEMRPWLADEVWRDYFKFAFVRNPWDRFISCAFFKNRKRPFFLANPRRYAKLLLESPRTMAGLFYRPQLAFLTDAENRLAVDQVGRFESLQDDFDSVCRRIGLPPTPLPHLNRSRHELPGRYYDDELRRKVEQFYEPDVRAFDYRFEGAVDDYVRPSGT
jgi:hypothetical protein